MIFDNNGLSLQLSLVLGQLQPIFTGVCNGKEMSIFWTYNKRKWGTTIADGRKDKW